MDFKLNMELLEDDLTKEALKEYGEETPGPAVRVFPSGMVLPSSYLDRAEIIHRLPIREDDTFVISFPKSGTTWVQEMVWLLRNGCDFERAGKAKIHQRFPFMEHLAIVKKKFADITAEEDVLNMSPPRFIKTHLSPELLPREIWTKKPKIIYVHRNPKDVITSYYHHSRNWRNYTGSFEQFAECFLQGKVIFGPFWDHTKAFAKRKAPYILYLTYEEMQRDLMCVVKKTAKFLEVDYEEHTLKRLVEHLHFNNMKENPSVNYREDLKGRNKPNAVFLREGRIGAWRDNLSPELAARFDLWTRENLQEVTLPFEIEYDW